MAVLSESKRIETWGDFMRELSRNREAMSLTKTELRAALDAVDVWVDTNTAAYNSALPAAAQSGLTASQKAQLLLFVVQKRFVEGV